MSCTLGLTREEGRTLARHGRGETAEPTLARRQAQFQVCAGRTRQRLYRFALRTLGNSQDAEDLTQEALTRAWTHFEAFDPQRTFKADPQRSFEAWVFQIANNLMIDQNRRRRRRQEISLDASVACMEEDEGVYRTERSQSADDPQDCLLAKESRTELFSTMQSLSPAHQTTLLLLAQERSYEQIARSLDCPLGTVRSRVHRARVMLERNLNARAFR